MKASRIILVVVAAIVAAAAAFLGYMGAFSRIEIAEREMGPYTFAYAEYVGPYSGVARPMAELDEKLAAAGFAPEDGIGIYRDNPAEKPAEELRTTVGLVIEGEDLGRIGDYGGKLDFMTLEKGRYLVAEFPIKNSLSYMLGPMKAYPAFAEYLEDGDIAVAGEGIEYYDMENMKILFMMKLE